MIDQFTDWCTPLLDNEERATTRATLNAFFKKGGLGVRLHQHLKQKSQTPEGRKWLDQQESAHLLGRREPLPLSDNYFLLFRHTDQKRLDRTAALIAATLNFKLVLDQGHIPKPEDPDIPLCPVQIKNLFTRTRIPGETMDQRPVPQPQTRSGSQSGSYSHIVVFYRGNLHALNLISNKGVPHTRNDILMGLEAILEHSFHEQSPGRSLGHLTTLRRADWARLRASISSSSKQNAHNFHLIDSALFTVHLEDEILDNNHEACDQLLHGNCGNRWYDKALQLIVFKNGIAGLNIERSAIDEPILLGMANYILGVEAQDLDDYSGAISQGMPEHTRLVFELSPQLQKRISRAASRFASTKNERTAKSFQFTLFGADYLQDCAMDGDFFIQCALQLAHYRLKNSCAAVSDVRSLHHFAWCRTQCIWPLSTEMKDWIEVILDDDNSPAQKSDALRRALKPYQVRIDTGRKGGTPVQHLTNLLNLYHDDPTLFKRGLLNPFSSGRLSAHHIAEALSFFKSPGWTKMDKNAFCTRFLTSPMILHHGCGAAQADNFSISCTIQPTMINIHLSGLAEHQDMLAKLTLYWQGALEELGQLLENKTGD